MKIHKISDSPDWADAVKDAKRDLLLRAARDEFVESGLEGASVRSIASRAGCTTGAIYSLFDSKESIYAALLDQSLDMLDRHVCQALNNSQTWQEQVEAACRAFLSYYLEHRFEINLGLYAFRGLKRQGVGKASGKALNQALWKVLEHIAEPLSKARRLPVTEVRGWVALLFSQMIGATVLQLAGRLDIFELDAKALLELMLVQLWAQPHPRIGGEIAPVVGMEASSHVETHDFAAKPKRRK
jgi:AcrR family transcriptional regulator